MNITATMAKFKSNDKPKDLRDREESLASSEPKPKKQVSLSKPVNREPAPEVTKDDSPPPAKRKPRRPLKRRQKRTSDS